MACEGVFAIAVMGTAIIAAFLIAYGEKHVLTIRGLAMNMIEERRINDELRHGYHWNDEKTVLDVLAEYSVCSFLAHDSALFRLALTLKYDAVVDDVRNRVKALPRDLSVTCATVVVRHNM